MRWYKKAADKGDAYAKQEWLKLQQKGLAPAAPMAAAPPPPPAGDRPRPERAGAPGLKTPAGAGRRDEGGAALPAGRLRPLRSAADRRKRREGGQAKQAPLPRPDARGGKTLARFARVYLAGAAAVAVLALVVRVLDWRSEPPGRSGLPAPAGDASLRWPGYLPAQPPPPAPPEEALREAQPAKMAPAAKAAVRPPALPVVPIAAAAPPPAPRLRSDYRTLDEAGIRDMLAARGLFDALRNPGGGARHRCQATAVSGVRLVVDPDHGLVWARQPNPVRMNLERSKEWIASLNRIAYGGIRSWRLPTAEEAASLLRSPGGAGQGCLDEAFGTGLAEAWTGDTQAGAASWSIDFRAGTLSSARNKARLTALMVSSDPVPAAAAAPAIGREG